MGESSGGPTQRPFRPIFSQPLSASLPVEVFNRQRRHRIDAPLLGRAARAAGPLRGPVHILVVGDAEIRRLNRKHLGHDWATDVVTFPMEEPDLWGEIVVSADTAAREAKARGIKFGEELALYVVHGVLHLRGYDDTSEGAELKMRRAEARSMKRLSGFF